MAISPEPHRQPSLRRIPALDGLRGIAIVLVLFHHLFVYEPTGPAGARVAVVAEFASHGVDLFFVLSGFLIARQLAALGSMPGFAARFWLHRAAKIVPLYLLVVFCVFVPLKGLLAFSGHIEKLGWLLPARQNWPWYVFFASNVRNAIDARFTNPALDVCWSLGIEVQFYILAFALARFVAPRQWPRIALACTFAAVAFRVGELRLGANWLQVLVLTPGRLDAFSIGAIAALAPSWLARLPAFIPYVVLCLPLFTAWSRMGEAVEIGGYTAVALAAGMFVERAARSAPGAKPNAVLGGTALVFMGRISYSIYLVHLPIRAAMRDMLLPHVRSLSTPGDWIAQAAYTLGTGATCIALGWLTWKYIEEPARRAVIALGTRAPSTVGST